MARYVRRMNGLATAVVAMALLAAGVLFPVGAASAGQRGPVVNGYLALGDSVAFGYIPPNAAQGTPNYNDPSSFVGYPEDLARALSTTVANSGCPGESTMSFLAIGAQSNGCENSVGSTTGYRTLWPLHVKYSGTQMAYALRYLMNHPSTQLVTMDIGANDAFICQETTSDHCVSEFGALLAQVKGNLQSIYQQIRDIAGYKGMLVTLTYYSTDYSNQLLNAETKALNAALAQATRQYGGLVASGFAAFEGPSASFGGSPCKAGLLIRVTSHPDVPPDCNIHPSAAGHLALAAAIARAIGA